MRGKISCSAQKLSLLEPSMIESIVDTSAYQIANHYLTENRVRIVEADEGQISSVVIGNSGVYDQTIRLKDGSLATKCTCSLNEQPFCRHSAAALLEYHRWVSPKSVSRTPDRPATAPAPKPAPSIPTLDIKLSEITAFVEWLQAVVKALEDGHVYRPGRISKPARCLAGSLRFSDSKIAAVPVKRNSGRSKPISAIVTISYPE